MNMKNATKKSPATLPVSAEDFPALQEFLRGYFHEDILDDYGSAAGAVQQFCEDADFDQRRAVANEWELFRRRTKDQPLDTVNRLLTETLGSAYTFSSLDEVKKISSIFAKNARPD
jgi:CdiI immunity protein